MHRTQPIAVPKADRMNTPVGYMSAIVAGVAFIVVAACASLLLSDHTMLRSTRWLAMASLGVCVLTASVIGYRRPQSRMIYVPLILGGLCSLGLCFYITWFAWRPGSGVRFDRQIDLPIACFVTWCGWAFRAVRQLRQPAETELSAAAADRRRDHTAAN